MFAVLVPLSWMQEYVDLPWSAHELAQRITDAGQKVESISCVGASVSGIVAGRVDAVHPHPRASRLQVCDVDIGQRRIRVVCGAPNVAVGQIVPVALPGSFLAGSDQPLTVTDLRGVESYGMLCAEDELGISDDHSGLMILPPDTAPGTDLVQTLQLGDAVIEFEIYPNRPDCLSVVGLAREVAALTGGELRVPVPAPIEAGVPAHQEAKVAVEAPDLCPRYAARIIRNVKIAPSPLWLQQRLRAAGMRPINNVVDVTNYVMLELGQPLHAFDLSLLGGKQIVVRRARPGEHLRTLDGQDRALDSETLVIADREKAVAIAGVMGGEDSEIRPGTTDLLLESASFCPVSVRKTSRLLGLRTEASARFEKGLDPHLVPLAADRAAELLARICGGQVAPRMIDVCRPLAEPLQLRLRPDRVNSVLGTQLTTSQMVDYLHRLGFLADAEKGTDRQVSVVVPSFRGDVTREIDLVEEIARMHGYSAIPATLARGAAVPGGQTEEMELIERIRATCITAGLRETISYSFTSPRHFDLLRLPADDPTRQAVQLANPLTEDLSVMRTTLLGNLLDALARNAARGNRVVHLFEIGARFVPHELPLTEQPEELQTLGIAMMGDVPGAWGDQRVDFYTLKGVLEALAQELSLHVEVSQGRHPSLHPGRTGVIHVSGHEAGFLGELDPRVQEAYELPDRAYLLELDLSQVMPLVGGLPRFAGLPRYPAVERDLALLVPVSTPAVHVARTVQRAAGELLERLTLFDVYQGKQVPDGYRSLAYSLVFRAVDRTLKDAEVNDVIAQVEQALQPLDVILRR